MQLHNLFSLIYKPQQWFPTYNLNLHMTSSQIQSNRTRTMWQHCVTSAFQTTLACGIVGGATLYGPKFITGQVAFPAFSYVTVILIVTNATLGHTFRCCWLALLATVQGVCPAILSLWLIGPDRLTTGTTAILVAISAFTVALPENTHLITKRIALGQIVIIYVIGFINGELTEPIMHPIHVAASTALGVVACVLALLLPYPGLAFYKVKESCRLYTENASERLNLFLKAFFAEKFTLQKAFTSQAKSLNIAGSKFLDNIKSHQENMHWETLPVSCFKSYDTNPGGKLQHLETVLSGLQIALENDPEVPLCLNSETTKDLSLKMDDCLNQIKSMNLEKTTLPLSDSEFLQTLQINKTPLTRIDLPSIFFIFCMNLLQANSHDFSPKNKTEQKRENFLIKLIDRKRLLPAVKCSISLGLAVLFGLMYSKDDGYWSGLPVAISLASSREPTFKVANVKAQGTVLGTVYGVLGCFIFETYVKIRIVTLIPWFIFCSFLCQSKMYGQAGGISAVIGAVLILGRTNFGTPSEFAIARIVETFIGLSCSIMVDFLFQPVRASVSAKHQLFMSFRAVSESVGSIKLESFDKLTNLEENRMTLKFHVNELGKFIEEAEVEPNFWFLPFHSASYRKLKNALSKMENLLLFTSLAFIIFEQNSRKMDQKITSKLESDLKFFKDEISSKMKCVEEVSLIKSLPVLENEFEKRKHTVDLEMGKFVIQCSLSDNDKTDKATTVFLQHMEEFLGNEIELKNQLVLSLCGLVFCMEGILRETKVIEEAIKELVQWENPSSHVDLHDISCKVHALG